MTDYAGHIPESFIEELLTRSDIVDVIGTRVPLKRAGANFTARCPFHTEKSPSFTVSPTKQFYHCFGCGAHGSAIRFLMEFEGIHFVEACESLAARVGLTLPANTENTESSANHKHLYELLTTASRFYQAALRKRPQASSAVEYLKSRGITGETAKRFAIGYAPPGWDNLIQHFKEGEKEKENGKEKEISDSLMQELIKAGLIISKEEGQFFDRFRERIIFPIRDRRGRVMGFGGRVLNKKDNPKYLNSPETPVFSKGKEVYGLYEAKLQNRNLTSFVIVEGYIDVICLSQFGIENVVATLGTALTEKHLELLFRQVPLLYFCFDGDVAGRAAAVRAMQNCLPYMKEGRRVKFVFLPQGEDPDSFVRKQGKRAFLDLLQRSSSLTDYLFDSLSSNLDLAQIDGRAALVTRARPLIERLPKGILQQMMFERLSELARLPSQIINKNQAKHQRKNQGKNQSKDIRERPPSPAERAIAMLLENKNLLSLIPEPLEFQVVDIPGTSLLCAIIDILHKRPGVSESELLAQLPEECIDYFESIDLKSIARFLPKEGIEAEFKGALSRLKERAIEQALEELLNKAKISTLTTQEKVQLRYLIDQKEKNRVD